MRKLIKTAAILCLLFAGGGYAVAKSTFAGNDARAELVIGETGKAARVISGNSLVLEDGLRIALAGIQTPKNAWPDKGLKAWPLADEARAKLARLTRGKTLQLYYGGDTRDRYGRALAQVWTLDAQGERDIWLQRAMTKAGYARVYPWASHQQDTQKLYTAERAARAAKRGIWDDAKTNDYYAVRRPDPNPLAQYVDSVQIVEGIILSAADVRGTIYLNFGSDYKTDFTIAIAKKNRKAFTKQGLDPLTLTGARVRVRGYIELGNGPIIWLNAPQRLEVLD